MKKIIRLIVCTSLLTLSMVSFADNAHLQFHFAIEMMIVF